MTWKEDKSVKDWLQGLEGKTRSNYLTYFPKFLQLARARALGVDKFSEFCDLLNKMSGLVVEMLEKDYFDSGERVEIAHVMSWMVGCTEYGKMSPAHWEIGYYDRIEDKCFPYLRQNFQLTEKSGT